MFNRGSKPSTSSSVGESPSDAFFQAEEKLLSGGDWKVQKNRQRKGNKKKNDSDTNKKGVELYKNDTTPFVNKQEVTRKTDTRTSFSVLSKCQPSKASQNQNESNNKEYKKPSNSFSKTGNKIDHRQMQNPNVGDGKDKRKTHGFNNSSGILTYSKLQAMSSKDSTDIIRILANSNSGLDDFLQSDIRPDMMYLIIKILKKLTESDWEENKQHVLMRVCSPEFFKKLTEFVTNLATDDQSYKRKEEMEQFFDNLLTFFYTVMIMLPSFAADHLTRPLRMTKMAMGSVEEFQNVTLSKSVNDKLKQLLNDFEERKKEKEDREHINKESKEEFYPKPLGSISEVSIFPRPEDIENSHGAKLPKNKVKGPYNDVEHYLDVQFRLLREDFIAPVRQGIQEYRVGQISKKTNKKTTNLRIYPKVKFLKPTVVNDKVGYDICFDPEKRMKVKWEYSKRFIFGSLLLFTNDNFHTFFLGTVINRNLSALEKNRTITVLLCDTNNISLSNHIFTTNFLMAESEVYFEPYSNVLRALQRFNSETFPLKKYIVFTENKTNRPDHTKNGSDIYTISLGDKPLCGGKTLKLFDDSTWPSCDELGFDTSQLNAYKAALTNDLVVIQGPPGTGKTYLGLKIAAALLENKAMWSCNHHTPILVLCYTNHALDQFLEGIIEKGLSNNLIRIGGRSKSELLESFNLRERRRSVAIYNSSYEQAALLRNIKRDMSTIFESIKILQDNLEHLNNNDGVLALRTLKIVMSDHQKNFFRNNDDLIEWLLYGIRKQVRSQKTVLTTDEIQSKRLNNTVELVFDPSDFENVTRLKEVLFDGYELEEENEQETGSGIDLRIYYTCTLDEIKKKKEDHTQMLDAIPGSEESRDEIRRRMRETKKAESDLILMHAYFEKKLKTGLPSSTTNTDWLNDVRDLNSLDDNQRWLLYRNWISLLKEGFLMLLCKQEENYRKGGRRYDEVRQFDDLRIVQQADIVGVTTTTAARLQAMLRELKPKIVIVEEAAEVLEAHIVASLSVHCQHLILIGDHKQLRPSVADYKIGKDCNLEVSLFERLINNGINLHTLTTQHRMRPEISKLLVPTIYPTLENHITTHNRERIRGIDRNVFFMTHNNHEEEVVDIMSKRNKFEARMVMSLARHLLLQGYKPDEITVLTTYSGQMYLLKEEQTRLDIPQALHVTAVDNFQGEENRIILLSLVRSNAENRIGFLKTENRVCVALSRAQDGLFVFGNMDCLIAGSSNTLWQRIKQSFVDQDAFGPALVLRCETHRDQLTRVVCPSDFNAVMEGGCSKPCREQLGCGHVCRSLCHVSKDRHIKYRCSQPCKRLLCADGHPCLKKCFENCGECNIPMDRTLKCGHQIVLPCFVAYNELQCKQLVKVRFPECQHEVQVECFRKDYKICPEPCMYRLDCGHACKRICHVNDDPNHLKFVCRKPCAKRPPGCTTNEHRCQLLCFEECEPCNMDVVKILPCGHSLTTRCDNTVLLCTAECGRTMTCGHKCKLPCYEECTGCPIKVEKTVPLCGHKVRVACSETPDKRHCKGQCCVRLECGHKCTKQCRDQCTSDDCLQPTPLPLTLPCGHTGALLPCNMVHSYNGSSYDNEELLQFCSEPCLKELSCGHRCSGTCGECLQGRIHKVCDEDCNNTLICGHSCPVPCRQICPPCEKNCQNRCCHSKCQKKCGEPCAPCNEPCGYYCTHSRCKRKCSELCDREPCSEPCHKKLPCKHACVGFCGEPCPPCKQCSPERYQPHYDIFGGPDEEDDLTERWVLLNDCKHVIESGSLEQWLNTEQDGKKEIKHKTCPLCRPTEPNRFIITTQRYMNLVKQTYKDIQMVKRKIFGEISTIREDREKLLRDVRQISPKLMDGFQGLNKDKDQLKVMRSILLEELPYIKGNRRNEISVHRGILLNCMATVYLGVQKRVCDDWEKLSDSSKAKVFDKVNFFISVLIQRKKKISKEEINSFLSELKRLHRFFDLNLIHSSDSYFTLQSFHPDIKSKVTDNYNRMKEEIFSPRVFTDKMNDKVGDLLKELCRLLNTHVTDEERVMVHKAMFGSVHGTWRWYKCAGCGDVYCVGNCGAVNQVTQCRKCNSTIGSSSRVQNPDMARALHQRR
ncbi:NFX1-type zinc finger-containing protein 1-like isoform X2 [Macrosteles quadrilineatus]|uniref:NFX1-type zinc finger-containing protein 1-like isoform X2 n=1 Tax=Macrosteles quadrilineatus TaxID=74068 RepID=UPI0023E2FDEE|nr:NFX1-type zinc finger-containing protein 1-like isoform X2 [Macrosteles quadrilineatus]